MGLFHARGKLDDIGRVIDFSVLKEKIGQWIDDNWDHNFIVYQADEALIQLLRNCPERRKDPFVMPYNPTAENMAEYLLKEVCPHVLNGTGVEVYKIELWETENCKAEVELVSIVH